MASARSLRAFSTSSSTSLPSRRKSIASLISLYHNAGEFPDARDEKKLQHFVDGRLLVGSNVLPGSPAEAKTRRNEIGALMKRARLGISEEEERNRVNEEITQGQDLQSHPEASDTQRASITDGVVGEQLKIKRDQASPEARRSIMEKSWKPLRSDDLEIQMRARRIIDALHGTEGGKSNIGEELIKESYAANESWRRSAQESSSVNVQEQQHSLPSLQDQPQTQSQTQA